MIRNIQFLRFIAAALVVFAHAPLTVYGVSPYLIKLGGFGVDIFFIISGFIIPFILYSGKNGDENTISSSWGFFLRRRIYRVWPLYFLMSLVVIVLSSFVSGTPLESNIEISRAYGVSKLDFDLFVESITFTHAFIAPIVNVGWTLQFEFAFYITIAIIMAVGARKYETLVFSYAAVLIASTLAMSFLSKVGMLTDSPIYRPLRVVSHPMMVEFLFGMILFRLFRKDILLGKWSALAIGFMSIPLFVCAEYSDLFRGSGGVYHRPLVWGAFAFLIVWSALSLEPLIRAPASTVILGDSSYSLYLVHWMALPWIAYGIELYVGLERLSSLSLILISLIICQTVAIIVHLKIEKPINNALRKL